MKLVAELSTNTNGSPMRAIKLIEAAAEAGCWGVKTTQFTIEKMFRPEALKAKPELLQRKKFEIPIEWHEQFSERAHELGLKYGCTPCDLDCVNVVAQHCDFLKIGSYSLLDRKLISRCSMRELPLVISTGMATEDEIKSALEAASIGTRDITLLHCVSAYPLDPSMANLAAMKTMRKFGHPVGFSDHSGSMFAAAYAIKRWKADMLEVHLDLGDMLGAEHKHSWAPSGLKVLHDLVAEDQRTDSSYDGYGEKRPLECEILERQWRADPTDGLRPLRTTNLKEETCLAQKTEQGS